MKIRIDSNFKFTVSAIHYLPNGELQIMVINDNISNDNRYEYVACLGTGEAEERPAIGLLEYAKSYATSASVKSKTKDSYRLMCNHLETYGDTIIDTAKFFEKVKAKM